MSNAGTGNAGGGRMSADMHALTGAYAMGALAADERDVFEEHLSTCGQCELEVRELLETTALLGVAASAPPPPDLRARVMDEIGRTRQLPPLLSQRAAAPAEQPAPVRASGRFEGRLRRWSLTAAACLAVFTIGLGAYATQVQRELSDLRNREEQIAAVQTAPDARSVTDTAGGTTATVTASRKSNQILFISRGLADPRKGRTYEIWLIGKDGPHPAGTFETTNGRHGAQIITGPGDAEKLAVTDEPDGGSPQPTTKPILVVDLPQT